MARNEPLSAEQRAPQSERLPQPQRRSPEWNGDGAKRFAGPFVTLRRSRTQDAARVEQLRGHTAKNLRHLSDQDESIFEIFAAVCRRRWPSGQRPQPPQRPADLQEVICRHTCQRETRRAFLAKAGTCEAKRKQACLDTANPHLNDHGIAKGFSWGQPGRSGGELGAVGRSNS